MQDVWAVALPRLDALGSDERRATPTVLRFLVTALLYRVNNLLRQAASAASRGITESAAALPASTRGPATRVVATEAARLTQAAIDELPERDRELVLLRGIEQRPNDEVARILGLGPNAASQAYRRALERLRARLPSSVFDEL